MPQHIALHMTYHTWSSFHLFRYSFMYKYDIDYILGPVSIYDKTTDREIS